MITSYEAAAAPTHPPNTVTSAFFLHLTPSDKLHIYLFVYGLIPVQECEAYDTLSDLLLPTSSSP